MDAEDEFGKSDGSQDKFSLDPEDPQNFLKLCSALRILVQRRLNDSEVDHADSLLHTYCSELIRVRIFFGQVVQLTALGLQLYGSGVIKPNHHYATHVAECVRNFGPLHDFWTFLFERLNKVLKSFRTNNHGQGDLETTFFTEFHKASQTSRLVRRRDLPHAE